MKAADIAVEVSLGIAVVTALICCLGLALMKDFFEKLHYMSTVCTVSSFFVLLAVVLKEGAGQAAIKMALIFVALLIMNAVLTHASARAARVRTFGTWLADPTGPIPYPAGQGEEMSEEARELNEC
ncbi:MAG: monovalent cation/H(+) antiporter subunit G [Acidobacteria bacterium]|nr:monovalent cation/H(+) antiporter subunit G [Acidobacteriota bacterium]